MDYLDSLKYVVVLTFMIKKTEWVKCEFVNKTLTVTFSLIVLNERTHKAVEEFFHLSLPPPVCVYVYVCVCERKKWIG